MPKIKLSTLLSGIKGKSNGSVFAVNNGGAYFRTNKWGRRQFSQARELQKSIFAGVSSSWRNLTPEQREDWNNAVAMYPKTNAWGDFQPQSGFELYQRLNTCRMSGGASILSIPPTPREQAVITTAKWDTPEEFLFIPQKGLQLLQRADGIGTTYLQYIGNDMPTSQAQEINVFMGLSFEQNNLDNYPVGTVISLYRVEQSTVTVECWLQKVITGNWVFKIEKNNSGNPTDDFLYTSAELTGLNTSGNNTFYFNFFGEDFGFVCNFWLNGENYIAFDTPPTTNTPIVGTAKVTVFPYTTATEVKAIIFDLRIFENSVPFLFQQNLHAGYFVGLNNCAYDFGKPQDVYNNEIIGGNNVNLSLIKPAQTQPVVRNVNLQRSNEIRIDISGTANFTYQLRLLAGLQNSEGKNVGSTRFAKCADLPFNGFINQPVSNEVYSLRGVYWTGQDLKLKAQICDLETGVTQPEIVLQAPKRKPRFKAGTELAGQVSK